MTIQAPSSPGERFPSPSAVPEIFFRCPATWQESATHVEIPIRGRTNPWTTIQTITTPIKISHSMGVLPLFSFLSFLKIGFPERKIKGENGLTEDSRFPILL